MQHAIITGGSSGIGKAIAVLLAKEGVNISIIARRLEVLDTAKAEIIAVKINTEQQVHCYVADVSVRAQIETAIEQSIQALGAPDLLITSAGIAHPGYFEELPLEIFEKTMAVNYFGSLYAIKSALPAMQKKQQGRIVILSSGAALIGLYGYTAYGSSKFALRGLAESLRGELKCSGIGVSIVYPPDTDTPQLVAENLTKPDETKLITGSAKIWSAEAVAMAILTGIKKNDFVIAPGLEIKLLQVLHSLIAPILNWYFDKLVKKVRSR